MDDIAALTWQPGPAGVTGPPGLAFRVARAGDAEAVVALVESAYRGESSRAGWTTEADLLDGQRTDLAEVTGLLAAPDVRILLAEDSDGGLGGLGGLVGCCQLERRDSAAYFGMFAVSPTRQGDGIGAALLDRAERHARRTWGALRMELLVISVRTELLAWYDRRGYRLTGQVEPFPLGDPHFGLPRRDDLEFVVMAKDLAAAPT